jgi:hypothetical protein
MQTIHGSWNFCAGLRFINSTWVLMTQVTKEVFRYLSLNTKPKPQPFQDNLRHILLNVNVNDAGGANISECCKVAI